MFPILRIGPLALPAGEFILLLGLWLGMSLSERHSPRFGVRKALVSDAVFGALLAGLVMARLAYVSEHLDAYLRNPSNLFSLDRAAFSAWGGFVGAALAGFVIAQRKKTSYLALLDALTPLFATLGAALPLANLASGAAYGTPTHLPWGISLWGAVRHPTQGYELLAGLFILAYVWHLSNTESPLPVGVTFLRFVALSAGAKVFLWAFRADLPILVGGLRSGQVLAWVVLAFSLWAINHQTNR